jgi:MOSC domain-containing protein YiiM
LEINENLLEIVENLSLDNLFSENLSVDNLYSENLPVDNLLTVDAQIRIVVKAETFRKRIKGRELLLEELK